MKIEIELGQMPATSPTMLPQAELHKGATGSLLAIQIKDQLFTVSIAAIIDQVLAGGVKQNEDIKQEVSTGTDNQDSSNSRQENKDVPNWG